MLLHGEAFVPITTGVLFEFLVQLGVLGLRSLQLGLCRCHRGLKGVQLEAAIVCLQEGGFVMVYADPVVASAGLAKTVAR